MWRRDRQAARVKNVARLEFTFRTFTTDTTAKIVVISPVDDSDPTISGVNVDTPSAVSVGRDGVGGITDSAGTKAVALYSWTFTVSDTLVPNIDYPITVTKGTTSISGTIRTQPSEEDFTLFFVSCDGRTNQTETTAKGCYGYIREVAESENVRAIIHCDDHGYVDGESTTVAATALDEDGNDVSLFAISGDTEYTFAVAYAMYLGLIDEGTHGHDVDRQWCHQNLPVICGVGDHELANNPETKSTITAAMLADSKYAFMNTIGAAQEYVSATNAYANIVWHSGPIEVISYDRLWGLTAETRVYDDGEATQASDGEEWLGSTQINEILAEIDSTSPFKLLAMSTDAVYLMDQTDRLAALSAAGLSPDLGTQWSASAFLGGQQPLHDYTDALAKSEWANMAYDKTLGSIATVAQSYGSVLFGCHGDMHRPTVKYNYHGENADDSQLSMYQFGSGSVNKRAAQSLHPAIVEGTSRLGSHLMYVPDWIKRTDGIGTGVNSCIRIDGAKVQGAWQLNIQIQEVDETTNTPTTVYSHTLKHGVSNAPEYLRRGFI